MRCKVFQNLISYILRLISFFKQSSKIAVSGAKPKTDQTFFASIRKNLYQNRLVEVLEAAVAAVTHFCNWLHWAASLSSLI